MVEEDPQSQDTIHQQEDVEMGDAEQLKPSLKAPSEGDEPPPTQSPSGTPGSAVGGSSITAVDSVHVRDVFSNEDVAPPAKRARKFSDADQASAHQTVAHVSLLCLVRHRWRANKVVFFFFFFPFFPTRLTFERANSRIPEGLPHSSVEEITGISRESDEQTKFVINTIVNEVTSSLNASPVLQRLIPA